MATARLIAPLLTSCALAPSHGLEMNASQQKHRNKHKSCDCQRQVHYFRYDIGNNIAFGHGRLLNVHPILMPSGLHGARRSHLRGRKRSLFSSASNKATSGWALPLSPRGRFHHRSVGLFGGSAVAAINASRWNSPCSLIAPANQVART
jgi:hypothetical protein